MRLVVCAPWRGAAVPWLVGEVVLLYGGVGSIGDVRRECLADDLLSEIDMGLRHPEQHFARQLAVLGERVCVIPVSDCQRTSTTCSIFEFRKESRVRT